MTDEQKPEGAAPPPPPPEAEPPNRGVMIVVSYLWPLAFVPLLLEKQDPEAQWHAKHGLLLFVAEFFAFVALGILAGSRVVTAVYCCPYFNSACCCCTSSASPKGCKASVS